MGKGKKGEEVEDEEVTQRQVEAFLKKDKEENPEFYNKTEEEQLKEAEERIKKKRKKIGEAKR